MNKCQSNVHVKQRSKKNYENKNDKNENVNEKPHELLQLLLDVLHLIIKRKMQLTGLSIQILDFYIKEPLSHLPCPIAIGCRSTARPPARYWRSSW